MSLPHLWADLTWCMSPPPVDLTGTSPPARAAPPQGSWLGGGNLGRSRWQAHCRCSPRVPSAPATPVTPAGVLWSISEGSQSPRVPLHCHCERAAPQGSADLALCQDRGTLVVRADSVSCRPTGRADTAEVWTGPVPGPLLPSRGSEPEGGCVADEAGAGWAGALSCKTWKLPGAVAS